MMTTQGFPVVINAFASDFWMWGATLCRVYACIGGIFGVASIMTMVVIGYDRYNVIVKGFKGTKITFGKAAIILILVWLYAALGCCPPFLGWGGYALGNTYIQLQGRSTVKGQMGHVSTSFCVSKENFYQF